MAARPLRSCIAVAAVAAVATLGCRGDRLPSDHAVRLARAAALGLPTDLRPDWGPDEPRGIACATRMRDASDSAVRLVLTTQGVHAETIRRGGTTVVTRWAEGKYAVTPAGRYGSAAGATLRVDCSRAAAITPPGA